MKIFITSGGTKVPIDPVRDITNMSHGTFGSKIATAALDQGHEVFYLVSNDGRSPFTLTTDFFEEQGTVKEMTVIKRLLWEGKAEWCQRMYGRYQEVRFRNYEDYAALLKSGLEHYKPDIIILAAAVSDYLTDASKNKVRSGDSLTIHLKPSEKLIGKVKQWCPSSFLVGFKLLVNASQDELLEAANHSIQKNGCDMVVANDFVSLLSGKHEIMLVQPVEPKFAIIKDDLASQVVRRVVERAKQCTTSS